MLRKNSTNCSCLFLQTALNGSSNPVVQLRANETKLFNEISRCELIAPCNTTCWSYGASIWSSWFHSIDSNTPWRAANSWWSLCSEVFREVEVLVHYTSDMRCRVHFPLDSIQPSYHDDVSTLQPFELLHDSLATGQWTREWREPLWFPHKNSPDLSGSFSVTGSSCSGAFVFAIWTCLRK